MFAMSARLDWKVWKRVGAAVHHLLSLAILLLQRLADAVNETRVNSDALASASETYRCDMGLGSVRAAVSEKYPRACQGWSAHGYDIWVSLPPLVFPDLRSPCWLWEIRGPTRDRVAKDNPHHRSVGLKLLGPVSVFCKVVLVRHQTRIPT